eukprot:m51a1_g13315 hypothetical protein (306) ;mRNA; r:26-1399
MLWLCAALLVLVACGGGACAASRAERWSVGYAYELAYGSHISWPSLSVDWSSEYTLAAWINAHSVALAAAGLVGADAAAGLVLQFNGSLALLAGSDPVWASGHMTAHIDPFRCPSEANGTARLYLNGEPAGRWAGIGASSTGRAPLVVGRTASDESGDSWAGLVDDVAVWARALSPAEVARLRGIGDSDMDAGLAEGLVLYARADSDTLDRSLDSGPGGHGGVPSRGELLYGGYRARVAYRPDCIAPRGQRACTPLSMASVCGDGAVTGAEECDGGPGCTATCSCAEGTARGEWGSCRSTGSASR